MKTKLLLTILAATLAQGCASYDKTVEHASKLSCSELVEQCNEVARSVPHQKGYVPDPGPTVTGYGVNAYSTGYNSAYATVTPYTRPSQQSYYNSGVAIGNAVRVQKYNTIIQVCKDQYAARCAR